MHGLDSGPAAPAPAQLDAVQQKRGGPTPTASQESPPKRARVTDVHQLAEHVDMSNVQLADRKPLRALPTSLLLLARAQLHYASLKRFQLPLTLPVSPANAHATNYASYLEQLGAIVLSLKAVIVSSRTSSGDLAAGRIELRARCQLVEILIREMDNSSGRAGPSGSSGEVEEIIAKGLAAANKVRSNLAIHEELLLTWATSTARSSSFDTISSPSQRSTRSPSPFQNLPNRPSNAPSPPSSPHPPSRTRNIFITRI